MGTWWMAMGRGARIGLVAGAVAIVGVAVLAGWWLLRTEQAVLFADLKAQDAAVLAAELDRQKVPYSLADGGTTLLVPKAQVHDTRLKVMGKELPLHGVVGLEMFNHADFGMTEFAQKINYQRALQGELTRTILSLQEIREARVHLALPEQGLFRPATARPKAGITLALRRGQALRPEQVSGLQRLVAASVPGLVASEVTVVDQQGLALSRAVDAETDGAPASARLDLKRETENYLSRKAGVVLERAFGPGQALASVDVTLNLDQVRVTTEDVLATPDGRGAAVAGVLVRERESVRDSGAPEQPREGRALRGSSSQRDVEYQPGRRVEQVVSHPGSIRRLHAVAVVRQALEGRQQEQVRDLVAAAIGASRERGDVVVVQSFMPVAPASETAVAAEVALPAAPPQTDSAWPGRAIALAGGLLLVVVGWLALRRRSPPRTTPATTALDARERQRALQRVEAWLHEPPAVGSRERALHG